MVKQVSCNAFRLQLRYVRFYHLEASGGKLNVMAETYLTNRKHSAIKWAAWLLSPIVLF